MAAESATATRMKEHLFGFEFTLNSKWRVHAACSVNCFNFGFEFYEGAFRINVGLLCLIFGQVEID